MYSRDSLPDGARVGSDPGAAGAAAPRVSVSAGFGSPSADPTARRIDLNDALIRHPQAAFVMRADGDGNRNQRQSTNAADVVAQTDIASDLLFSDIDLAADTPYLVVLFNSRHIVAGWNGNTGTGTGKTSADDVTIGFEYIGEFAAFCALALFGAVLCAFAESVLVRRHE